MEVKARDYINKVKPNLVDNWSNQASLLSYDQVAKLMESYHEYLKNPYKLSDAINEYKAIMREDFDKKFSEKLNDLNDDNQSDFDCFNKDSGQGKCQDQCDFCKE